MEITRENAAAVAEQMRGQPITMQGDWRSTYEADRPMVGQKVLVYDAQGPCILMAYWSGKVFLESLTDMMSGIAHASHWMPLPEPPC